MAMAFDGTNLWITHYYDGTVTIVRPRDGAVVSTIQLGRGAHPHSLAFDGLSMWVGEDNGAYKISTQDFNIQGAISMGAGGITFDGTNIWIAGSEKLVKVRVSDMAIVGNITVPGGSGAVASDGGANLWVITGGDGGSVTKIRTADGNILGSFPVGYLARYVIFDGTNIWVTDRNSNLTKIRASDGTILNVFTGFGGQGLAFDGNHIWLASGGYLLKIRASDGSAVGNYFVDGVGTSAVAFDGVNTWVTSGGNVFKF